MNAADSGPGSARAGSFFEVDRLPDLERQGATVSKFAVRSLLREVAPADARFKLEDEQYFFVTRGWVEEMLHWLDRFLGAQLARDQLQEYLRERPREVAQLLQVFAEWDVQQRRVVKEQALIGLLAVECHRLEAQVPIDGHVCFFVIFGAREGFYVLEPVTGRIEPFREFRLRDDATFILF